MSGKVLEMGKALKVCLTTSCTQHTGMANKPERGVAGCPTKDPWPGHKGGLQRQRRIKCGDCNQIPSPAGAEEKSSRLSSCQSPSSVQGTEAHRHFAGGDTDPDECRCAPGVPAPRSGRGVK